MTFGILTGLAAEARLARGLGVVAAGGGTAAGARDAVARLVQDGATGLISFGLAGGLDPALRPGALVIPQAVRDAGETFAADGDLLARLGGASHGILLASDTVAATAAAKHLLHQATGAVAVDMESGVLARAAQAAGLPFAALRAVCDPAERSLPPAALMALDGAGVIGMGRVLGSLAAHPGQLPALLALARDAARARAALVRRVDDIRRRGGLVG